jgi:hypothetical protein
MVAIPGKLRTIWQQLRHTRPFSWIFGQERTGSVRQSRDRELIAECSYDPDADATFTFLHSTPERVKRLREAAKKAGLDIKIGEEPAEPLAEKPTEPVHKER